MTRIRRAVALAAMLAFLAMSTVGAGWVLCTGVDGHVAIEVLASGCCGDDEPGSDHEDDERDCGDCQDVFLAQLNPARDGGDDVPDVNAPVLVATLVDTFAAPAADASATLRSPRAPPHPPPNARHLATTVLRL